MVVLRYVGSGVYRGADPDANRLIVAAPGQTVTVSDAKARQLLRDFPDAWQVIDDTRPGGGRRGRHKMRRPRRNK